MGRFAVIAAVTVVIFLIALPLTIPLLLNLDDWRETAQQRALDGGGSSAQAPGPPGAPAPPGPPGPPASAAPATATPVNAGAAPSGAAPTSAPPVATAATTSFPATPAPTTSASSPASASASAAQPSIPDRPTVPDRPSAADQPTVSEQSAADKPAKETAPAVTESPPAEPAPKEPPPKKTTQKPSSAGSSRSNDGFGTPRNIPRTFAEAQAEARRIQEEARRMHEEAMKRNRAASGGTPSSSAADGSPPGHKVSRTSQLSAGDAVHIFWGAQWFEGSVIGVQGKLVRVHYDGWSENFDETVPLDRVRLKEPKSGARTSTARAEAEAGAADQPRTWTDSSGQFQIEATLVGIEDGKAQLRKSDGTVVAVPLDKLSPADRQLARELFP